MERLSFDEAGSYDGLEAAIHLARYAFARPLCEGKAVLDMACGEGYGSRLLADWGARQVVGVDVSSEAVENAERRFGSAQVQYRTAAAQDLVDLFPPASFDLIVSLETIEHVPDPVGLLEGFRRLLVPGGILVISCPNDWWYYPTDRESNPFHLRKYTFEEFREQSERVLGPSKGWYLGGPMAGFCNTRMDGLLQAEAGDSQATMLRALGTAAAFAIPSEVALGVQSKNASYFVGVWGDDLDEAVLSSMQGASILPVSMDAFSKGFFAQTVSAVHGLQRELHEARQALASGCASHSSDSSVTPGQDVFEERRVPRSGSAGSPEERVRILLQQLEIARAEARSLKQAEERIRLERDALVQTAERIRLERDALVQTEERVRLERDDLAQGRAQVCARLGVLEIEAARYRRMRSMVPAWARRMLMPLARRLKRMVRSFSHLDV